MFVTLRGFKRPPGIVVGFNCLFLFLSCSGYGLWDCGWDWNLVKVCGESQGLYVLVILTELPSKPVLVPVSFFRSDCGLW